MLNVTSFSILTHCKDFYMQSCHYRLVRMLLWFHEVEINFKLEMISGHENHW
jgi:hypothetical protein